MVGLAASFTPALYARVVAFAASDDIGAQACVCRSFAGAVNTPNPLFWQRLCLSRWSQFTDCDIMLCYGNNWRAAFRERMARCHAHIFRTVVTLKLRKPSESANRNDVASASFESAGGLWQIRARACADDDSLGLFLHFLGPTRNSHGILPWWQVGGRGTAEATNENEEENSLPLHVTLKLLHHDEVHGNQFFVKCFSSDQ